MARIISDDCTECFINFETNSISIPSRRLLSVFLSLSHAQTHTHTHTHTDCVTAVYSTEIAMEIEIRDHILAQIRKKYSTITNAYKNQCPRWLKSISSLELVEEPPYSSNHSRSREENTEKLVRLPLSYGNLFKGVHDKRKFSKRILIVGEPGIGKTILCASIAEDWANGKLFQEFFMVVLLPLYQKGVASAQTLTELLTNLYEFDSKLCSTIEGYLKANNKENILIMADGWSELHESEVQEESFLYRLLFGNVLPSSSLTVIVTSRSTSVPHQFNSRYITVEGFSEETAKSYIKLEVDSNPERLSYLIEQLDTNPLIGSISSVPLNLAMICNLCHSCSRGDSLPNTMPELYDKLVWSLIQLKINSDKELSNYEDLSKKSQQSWLQLCELAFNQVESGMQTQREATSYLSAELETFGLLKPISYSGSEVVFFLLPVFQYHLAVLHLMTLPHSVQLEVIEKVSHVSPMFLRFFLSMNENVNSDIISKAVQTLSKLHHSCNDLCLLSLESKNEIVNREVVKSLHAPGSTIMLHSRNAYDSMAMIYVLEKIEQQCTVEINFQNSKLRAMQVSKLANVLSNQSKWIKVKGLDLSDNGLNDSVVVNFFNRSASTLRSLEKLFLRSCGIGTNGLSAIMKALSKSSCKNLVQLDLSFNYLSVDSLKCFQCYIDGGSLPKLEILILKGSLAEDVNMSFMKCFATTLSSRCQCLWRLDLTSIKLGACDDPNLSDIVSQLTASLGTSFDLQLDDCYMYEVDNKFLTVMEESIRNKGMIAHTIAHGVFVGPGRSGKNTLLKRLTGEGPPDPNTISPSTGVLENVVKVEVKKLCAVATAVHKLKWQRLEYDEEALELMMTTVKNYSRLHSVPKPTTVNIIKGKKSKSRQEMKLSLPSNTESDKKSEITAIKAIRGSNESESTNSVPINENEDTNKHVIVYCNDLAPVDIFKKAVKLRHMDALREHLESSWSLYLTNVGGQVEFQENLPFLVCGPSIFFVLFPLHHDLNKPYEVKYQYPDGSIKKYSSTPTLIQELLQTLATIYTLDCVGIQIGDTDIKPKVFIIGTHKDCLHVSGSDLEKVISHIDSTIQRYIRQTSLFHQGSIQFASQNRSESRLIFTVNNLSEKDDDFQIIRSAMQQIVEKRCITEFTVNCPSSWLVFSLILRAKHMSNRILKLEDCFKIAQECGISSHEELTTALSFIHSRLGLVRYFNVEKLNSLVVIDPQVLFDKITNLIVETFISENAEVNEIEEFQEKGFISVAVMEKISEKSNEEVQLPFTWLTRLLNHLRIAALFEDCHGKKYFFPSVLCHVPAKYLDSPPPEPQANQLPLLLIAFKTGFCPRGISGALIKCLMTNEMKSRKSWYLLPHKIFRNQVSFSIEACGNVTLKILPTHFEIALDPEEDCNSSEAASWEDENSESNTEFANKLTCNEAYTQIDKCMKIVTSLYKRCEYFWTFYCTRTECKTHPHPAMIEWDGNCPHKLRCTVSTSLKRTHLPKGYQIWNIVKDHDHTGGKHDN